jgi:hypothetical protein
MTTLEDIEKAVTQLPADQLAKFRAWFEEFEAARFDRRIERDAKAGRLDKLAEQALADFRAGRARDLLRHFASPSFWEAYAKLPEEIRALADRSYALLKKNPRYPSLRLKKIGRFWSVRVGIQRIFASEAAAAAG